MSTRCYPKYVRGNPQLRIFLPDFWMILKKPENPLPPNKVLFHVPLQMTKYDVKNYLEKIYKIPVIDVKTRVVCGEFKLAKSRRPYMIKEDDYTEAIVDLPKYVNFQFPDIYGGQKSKFEDQIEKFEKQFEYIKKKEKRQRFAQNRHNVPDWFGL